MVSRTSDGLTRFLNAPWLEGVPTPVQHRIWKVLQEQSVAAESTILVQNQPLDQLWFVADGSVVVERTRTDGHMHLERLVDLSGPAIYGTTTFFRQSLPTMTIRATSPLSGWTLDRSAYQMLRTSDPAAAEALALAAVRVLSERFDLLDRRLTQLMADHPHDQRRVTEWTNFRSRLFEEPVA